MEYIKSVVKAKVETKYAVLKLIIHFEEGLETLTLFRSLKADLYRIISNQN